MATFLNLVNDVERESGTISQEQRLTTVASPTGRQEKIVEHVKEAWRLIQTSRSFWSWRRVEFSQALTIGQKRYGKSWVTADNVSRFIQDMPGFSPFSVYDSDVGQGDEQELCYLPYHRWRSTFDRRSPDNQRPGYYSISNAGELCIGAPPDKAYVLRGEYIRTAQILSADDDEPICPEDFHQAIVWRALMLLHGHDEGQFSLGDSATKFAAIFRDMVNAEPDDIII